MVISIEFTGTLIDRPQRWEVPVSLEIGALVEFYGMVRETEGSRTIAMLEYEAFVAMAEKVMREKIDVLSRKHPVQAVRVVHRLGKVPVGESAIYVGVQAKHRREGFLFLQEFMDEFKRDVPIWKNGKSEGGQIP